MKVTDYLRDIILECYSNKLRLSGRLNNIPQQFNGKADHLQEIEWDATMEKVSQQVVEKISQVVLRSYEKGRASANGD